MSQKILVVEDDAEMADYLVKGLGEAGFVVDHAAQGRDGLYMASSGSYDAIILDRMLPELDGLSLLKALRAAEVATPVMILSAMSAVDERVKGLKAGADDYLVKPFGFSELLARLEVLLRRRAAPAEISKLTAGALEMDLLSRVVTREGTEIELQPKEFKLLEYLLRNKGRTVTRTMLLEHVWEYHFDPQTNVIDVHVSRLRQKVDKGYDKPVIQTVRGVGYRLVDA